jgi:hypothetical protein
LRGFFKLLTGNRSVSFNIEAYSEIRHLEKFEADFYDPRAIVERHIIMRYLPRFVEKFVVWKQMGVHLTD